MEVVENGYLFFLNAERLTNVARVPAYRFLFSNFLDRVDQALLN